MIAIHSTSMYTLPYWLCPGSMTMYVFTTFSFPELILYKLQISLIPHPQVLKDASLKDILLQTKIPYHITKANSNNFS